MFDVINSFDLFIEEIELEKGHFKQLNSEQKIYLQKNYNTSSNFSYVFDDEYESVFILTTVSEYKRLRYYLGLEYEDEKQLIEFKCNDRILLVYEGSNRIIKFIEKIEEMNKDDGISKDN